MSPIPALGHSFVRSLIPAILILLGAAAPALAHTDSELEAWEDDWNLRAGIVLEGEDPWLLAPLISEWRAMADRHPCQMLGDCPPPRVPREPATYRGIGSDVERWRSLVASYFPASQVDRALQIMRCESGGNPSAKNPRSTARGLFQILASLWAPHYRISSSALYDPEINVRLAADIWRGYGWGAWSCA